MNGENQGGGGVETLKAMPPRTTSEPSTLLPTTCAVSGRHGDGFFGRFTNLFPSPPCTRFQHLLRSPRGIRDVFRHISASDERLVAASCIHCEFRRGPTKHVAMAEVMGAGLVRKEDGHLRMSEPHPSLMVPPVSAVTHPCPALAHQIPRFSPH